MIGRDHALPVEMLRVVLVVGLLGCRHGAPSPAIGNTAATTPSKLTPDVVEHARVLLKRAQAMTRMMMYAEAYASAQRGINLLDGDPDLDDGALLEVSNTQAAANELVIMADLRTRELERRISQR